jgi:nicotinamidase/pyrazinamidase
MPTANIIILIDIQNGFAQNDLTPLQGGSLYVPGGEEVGEPAARLLRNATNSTIILSQDYHPPTHISFASNHWGAEPFSNIHLKRGVNGLYNVADTPSAETLEQTLWTDHCVQRTESALFADEIMAVLPEALQDKLHQHGSEPLLRGADVRGNRIYVVRKGMRPDLDSYGIVTENDGQSTTAAPEAFDEILARYQRSGVTTVRIYIGGLATNYCVEFSHRDIYKHLVPRLRERGLRTDVYLLTDTCRGIPQATPGGEWPDLDHAIARMKTFGTSEITTDTAIRHIMQIRRFGTRQLRMDVC